MRSYIDDLYSVIVSDGHENEFPIFGQFNAARSLTDLDRVHDREFVGIYHADGIALLVRDIGGEGARLGADEGEDANAEQAIARAREAGARSPQKASDAGLRRHRLFEPASTFR